MLAPEGSAVAGRKLQLPAKGDRGSDSAGQGSTHGPSHGHSSQNQPWSPQGAREHLSTRSALGLEFCISPSPQPALNHAVPRLQLQPQGPKHPAHALWMCISSPSSLRALLLCCPTGPCPVALTAAGWGRVTGTQNHGIIMEKTSEIMKSNCSPSTAVTTNPNCHIHPVWGLQQ